MKYYAMRYIVGATGPYTHPDRYGKLAGIDQCSGGYPWPVQKLDEPGYLSQVFITTHRDYLERYISGGFEHALEIVELNITIV